ncbi:MAG: hypothetical protein IK085_07115, partial [Clostridia bacterium]|nr:hypothetical protein [Clostridia bacterium]
TGETTMTVERGKDAVFTFTAADGADNYWVDAWDAYGDNDSYNPNTSCSGTTVTMNTAQLPEGEFIIRGRAGANGMGWRESDNSVRLTVTASTVPIGEVQLTANMNLYPLFRGGRCSYGVTDSMQEQSFARYVQLLSGECEIMDFINVFASELPFIPLCYRSGLALYTNSIDYGGSVCCVNDVFCNVDRWTVVKDD